jgi:hypothetical protein
MPQGTKIIYKASFTPGDTAPQKTGISVKRKNPQTTLYSGSEKFAVYTSSLGNYFFGEIRDLVAAGLEELGFKVLVRDERDGFLNEADWHIVIAPHEFFYLGTGEELRHKKFPPNLILFNTEQPSTKWFSLGYECFSKAHVIWDINFQSSQLISDKGLACDYLPLGYVPGFNLFQGAKELLEGYGTCFLEPEIRKNSWYDKPLVYRPIDVLFTGALTQRREKFFAKSAPVLSNYLCYLHFSDLSRPLIPGQSTYMDTPIVVGLAQRSKILINIHHGQDKFFEWHRIVMHGIWQRALVISEPCGIAPPFRPGIDFVEAALDEIPKTIEYYLSTSEGEREAQTIADQGFKTLTEKCSLADSLRQLCLELGVRIPG